MLYVGIPIAVLVFRNGLKLGHDKLICGKANHGGRNGANQLPSKPTIECKDIRKDGGSSGSRCAACCCSGRNDGTTFAHNLPCHGPNAQVDWFHTGSATNSIYSLNAGFDQIKWITHRLITRMVL